MPITYNRPVEEDGLYKIEFQKGFAKGFQKGLQEGKREIAIKITQRLFSKTEFSSQEIANLLDLDIDFVKAIMKQSIDKP